MTNDNEDTTVSEPTTDVVDTSTNEELQDTDVDLEDDDTSFDDGDDDTEESEASEDEIGDITEDDEAEDTEPTTEEESKEDDSEPEPEAEPEELKPSEEDIKKHNQEMAARRIADKQAKEEAKRQAEADLLNDAEDDTQLALRQLQIDAYNNRIEKNINTLENDMQKAVANIELFKTGSPEVKEELIRRASDFEAKHVELDQYGDPRKVTGNLYEYLQNEADSIQRILNTGARQEVKNKAKAKTRTDTLPSRAPKEPKIDPDLQAFDDEVAKWA
jgi:hypothetical protein